MRRLIIVAFLIATLWILLPSSGAWAFVDAGTGGGGSGVTYYTWTNLLEDHGDDFIAEDDPRWDCETMGDKICG